MKEIKIETVLEVYEHLDELPEQIQALMNQAREARTNSYSPYSKFSVGAALLLDNGEVVTGSNQENASYPSGLCAERTAIYYAGAKYPHSKMKIMAIMAGSNIHPTTEPIPPCGACRQAIAEYEVNQKKSHRNLFHGGEW